MAANDINTNIDVQASSTPDVSMITYNEVLALIYRTLIERPEGHEIQPEEHQVMATAILNYARTLQVLGSSIFQGFATTNKVPQVTGDQQVAYISVCSNGTSTTFNNFRDQNGNPLVVTCGTYVVKVVVLLWNTSYWEKQELAFNFEDLLSKVIDGGNAQGVKTSENA